MIENFFSFNFIGPYLQEVTMSATVSDRHSFTSFAFDQGNDVGKVFIC